MATTTTERILMPLRQVRHGMIGTLTVQEGIGANVQRLMAMGLVPGTEVQVRRIAPLGDPILLQTRSFEVSLRKHEAEGLAIEIDPDR